MFKIYLYLDCISVFILLSSPTIKSSGKSFGLIFENTLLYIFGFLFQPVNLKSNISLSSSFLNSPDFSNSYDIKAAFNLIFVSGVIPQPVADPLKTHLLSFLSKSNSKLGGGLYGLVQSSGNIFVVIRFISSWVGILISLYLIFPDCDKIGVYVLNLYSSSIFLFGYICSYGSS